MFSLSVVGSDEFLDMPVSARELYFQLGMYADDDGFVSHKRVQRTCGATNDDMKVLVAKRFVIPFESGVIVLRHWNENNYIQKDRYKPSLFSYEKGLLTKDENNVYILDTECTRSIGKGSIVESVTVSNETASSEEKKYDTFEDYMESMGYHHDSIVDSDGAAAEWWEGESGKLSKSEVKAHHGAYKRLQGHPTAQPQSRPEVETTERFLQAYSDLLKERFGKAPVIDSKAKVIVRKGLIEKYPKDEVKAFVKWFVDCDEIDKKWKYNIESLASTKFMNQFLSQ